MGDWPRENGPIRHFGIRTAGLKIMFDDPVRKVMLKRKLLTATPKTLVATAARRMAARNAGAVLVVEGGALVGILSERDIVFRVVCPGLDARTTRIAEVMTPDPITIHPDRPFGYALVLMRREGFRHLPVVEDGKVLGIVSARSALDPELEEFASETSRRKHFDNMDQG
jgi:CBS domain-containing protein